MATLREARRLHTRHAERRGKILVLFAVVLPSLLGVVGLVLDGSLLQLEARRTQQVADAAALAAARSLIAGETAAFAVAEAERYTREYNGLAGAEIEVHLPPVDGDHAGLSGYVEVVVRQPVPGRFVPLPVGGSRFVRGRAVAGSEDATDGVAIAVLDPSPEPFSLGPLPLTLPALPALPALVAGMEVLGAGAVEVRGAVVVNTEWGGLDEEGEPIGSLEDLYRAIHCTPLLPLTRLRARDIRVVGGVDDPAHYGHVDAGEPSPLVTNVAPVDDPLANLPAPTVASDPDNVVDESFGGVTIAGLPLIGPVVTLEPGVYEWISVVSGRVRFEPGIYVVRGAHPVTGMGLSIVGGEVTADGVMFYVTNSTGYSATSGFPDAADGEAEPPAPGTGMLVPSVFVNAGLLQSSWSPLDDPGSPFDGMLFYQRRADRRPIVIVGENLLGSGAVAGTIYAKWGHVLLALRGTYDLRVAAGTLRFANLLGCTIAPSDTFPPVREISLVE